MYRGIFPYSENKDKPRSGKPKKFDHDTRLKIIEIACRKPEEITHRSTRARKAGEVIALSDIFDFEIAPKHPEKKLTTPGYHDSYGK